jgi:septum formation protein
MTYLPPKLILASASPRRRRMLSEAGYHFVVDPSGIDEPEPAAGDNARVYAAQLALRKAMCVAARHREGVILAADTACAVGGQILNKPHDRDDAERMLRAQEGREVQVVTALVLYQVQSNEWLGAIEMSTVFVRPLSDAERIDYLDSGQWRGKAGAYGVQDEDPFVTVLSGSWSNVVGLPMEKLRALVDKLANHPRLTSNDE